MYITPQDLEELKTKKEQKEVRKKKREKSF